MNFNPFPWQERAIDEGIFKHQNMVLCWPTSSGKTFILIEAMLRAAVQGKRSVLILPGVDSVKEKADILWKRYISEYSSADIEVAYVYQGSKFFKSKNRRKPPIQECQIIIATYESLDKLLRKEKHLKGETHFKNIDIIAADEIHKIYNEKRGDTSDKVVTLLRYLNPDAQVLFSIATQSGAQELARWIKGNPLFEDRRPTNIAVFIYCLETKSFQSVEHEVPRFLAEIQAECEVEFYTQLKKVIERYREHCLIFNGTRRKTVSYALEYLTYKDPSGSLEGELFDKLIWARTGYLNAGLSKKARKVMTDAYKSGEINTLHTTTLIAESFDSDTSMVIVSDIKLAGNEIDPADLEQMLGRIRRPFHVNRGYPFGIGIVLAQKKEQVSRILGILHSSPDFGSKLEIYDSFLDQVLSLLKHCNWEECEYILGQTFFAFLKKEKFRKYICAAKQDLKTIGFLDEHGRLTSQAKAVVQYFIPLYIARKLISMKYEFYSPDFVKSLEIISGVFTECRFERFGRTPATEDSNSNLYEEGISEIQTKSRFMTKEQLLTLLLLHIHQAHTQHYPWCICQQHRCRPLLQHTNINYPHKAY